MRKDWNEFFVTVAEQIAGQSTCMRRQVGAVIVKDRRILSTGYNGAPAGIPHCETRGCLRIEQNVPSGERYELCWAAHAEQNAINNAAKHGISIDGADLYCTDFPCVMCAKSIVNSGIKAVYYINGPEYPMSKTILANLTLIKIDPLNHTQVVQEFAD